MIPRHSQYRTLLHLALAIQLLVVSWHCAWESHHLLEANAAAVAHQGTADPLPFSAPRECENESGCICRGAIQARSADLSHLGDDQQSQSLAFAQSAATDCCPVPAVSRPYAAVHEPPRLSGRQLRAHYASLVI